MDEPSDREPWTGAWIVIDRDGTIVDGSSRWFRAVDHWLAPSAIAAFWTCFELEWVGLADVSFTANDGSVVRFLAEEETCGWRLTCIEETAQARLGDAELQADRISVLTDFAGTVARELIDPMSVVQAKIELVLDLGIDDPAIVRKHLEVALQHAERVSQVLDNLRRIGQPQRLESERWAVAALVEEVLNQLGAPTRPKVQLQLESALQASGPRPIAARVLASLVRTALQRRGRIWIAGRVQRGHPTISVGPTPHRRGPPAPLRPQLASHVPLVLHLGGTLEVFSDGEDDWIELSLPRPAPQRPRRVTQAVPILILGAPGFLRDAEQRLGPHGFTCILAENRRDALAAVVNGRIEMALFEVELSGPGPRGHALAYDLAARFPEVEFFVALRSATRPPPLGRVRFARWPLDVPDLVRSARGDG